MLVTFLKVWSVRAVWCAAAACLTARSKYWHKDTHILCSEFSGPIGCIWWHSSKCSYLMIQAARLVAGLGTNRAPIN